MAAHEALEAAVLSARGALEAAESRLVQLSDEKHAAEERRLAAKSTSTAAEFLKLKNAHEAATDAHAAGVREHAQALASLNRAEAALEDARSVEYTATLEARRSELFEACMVPARKWYAAYREAEHWKAVAAENFPPLSAQIESEIVTAMNAWGPGGLAPFPDPSSEDPNMPRTLDALLRSAMREVGAEPMDPRGVIFDTVQRAHAAFAADSQETARRQREAQAERTNARAETPLSATEQAQLGYVLATESIGFGLLGAEVVSLGLDADHALAMAGANIVRNGAEVLAPDDPRIVEAIRAAIDSGAYERASVFRLPFSARGERRRQPPPTDAEVTSWWAQELRSRGGAPRPVRADDAPVKYIPQVQYDAIEPAYRAANVRPYDPELGPPPMVAP